MIFINKYLIIFINRFIIIKITLYITFLNLLNNKFIIKFIKSFFYNFVIIKRELSLLYDRYRDDFVY